tara:strand:- start:414 stop:689 length:276 start_codon:yes stop_codon:yes gene_type:complete
MCVGNLFGGSKPSAPPPPPRRAPAPTMRAAAPPPEMPTPRKIAEETGEDEKLSTRKKKALEIKKTKEGVKQLGAIDPGALPTTPPGGVSAP